MSVAEARTVLIDTLHQAIVSGRNGVKGGSIGTKASEEEARKCRGHNRLKAHCDSEARVLERLIWFTSARCIRAGSDAGVVGERKRLRVEEGRRRRKRAKGEGKRK